MKGSRRPKTYNDFSKIDIANSCIVVHNTKKLYDALLARRNVIERHSPLRFDDVAKDLLSVIYNVSINDDFSYIEDMFSIIGAYYNDTTLLDDNDFIFAIEGLAILAKNEVAETLHTFPEICNQTNNFNVDHDSVFHVRFIKWIGDGHDCLLEIALEA